MDSSAAQRSRRRGTVIFLLILMAFFIRRSSHRGRSEEPPVAGATSTTKYVAERDEGLGASVAILLDNSGSMKDVARDDRRPKYLVAREAIEAMLATTDSFAARQPDFPVNVGLYQFASTVTPVIPVQPYNRRAIQAALEAMPYPNGGTAIGNAMDAAREDLYRAGTIRKYILVVTDGQNTDGRAPSSVAREIHQRSEGAVRMYFVAFDVDASRFDFVHEVQGEVLEARNGGALRASLDSIYRGRILAESMNAGETLPEPPDASAKSSESLRPPTRARKPK
jgi:hypothetical protein